MSRHALVTGASSGIGAAIVDRLLAEGWQVTGVARRAVTRDLPAFAGITADLATPEGADAVLGAVSGVTAFIHAAGVMSTAPLGGLNAAAGADMWQLHVAAAERLANGLVAGLPAGGRIILIGSRTASGSPTRSQYAATKAALVAMARSWAMELAPRGITANVVAPAATETPMLTAPTRAGVAPRVPPIGRLIQPAEVAVAVAFLASAEAGAITGQVLTICGGSSL